MSAISEHQKSEIKEIICEILELDLEELAETDRFVEDHGADSLRAIEILASLERRLGVELDQADLSRMTTLEEVYTVVGEAKARV